MNVGVTNGAMLTFTELEPVVQPVELETVTLYVPAVVAVMVCDVAPVFQLYDGYPLPTSRTTLPPAQNDNGPEAVILGVITSGSTYVKISTARLIHMGPDEQRLKVLLPP